MRILRKFLATLLSLGLLVTVMAFPSIPVSAATGTISALSQTVVTDGTAPFDAIEGPGLDSSGTNGMARTRDTIDLRWDFVVDTAGDVTFSQTLVNALWMNDSAGSCAQGLSAISSDRRTLTCTLSGLQPGAGSYPVRARIDGKAANGSNVSGRVSSGALQSNDIAVQVSATPKMNISTLDLFVSVSYGPGSRSQEVGYNYDVPIALWADVTGSVDGFSGLRGLESLSSSISFSAVPNIQTAVLVNCFIGAAGGTRPSLPDPNNGNGTTSLNAARNSGSWNCAQPSAGQPVSVTISGADSSLNSYPIKSANNSDITSWKRAYFSIGYVRLWIPKSATAANAVTQLSTAITQFDPVSVSGTSNYENGYAPNQPSSACAAGSYKNCSVSTVNRIFSAVIPDMRAFSSQLGPLPAAAVSWDGLGQVVTGDTYLAAVVGMIPNGNDQATDTTVCVKWDASQTRLDPTTSIYTAPGSLPATIEYGTNVSPTLTDLQRADCGRPGVNTTGWHSSVSSAGGAEHITAIRVTFVGQMSAGDGFEVRIPQRVTASLTPGQSIGFFASASTQEIAAVNSSYVPTTHSGASGTRVRYLEARTGVGISWDVETSSAPATRTVTITPQLLAGSVARDTSVVLTLPSPCFELVSGSASISPQSSTPANLGADGVGCSSDDGQPATYTFSYGDIASTPQPITLRVNVAAGVPIPTSSAITATIVSASDPIATASHSAEDTLYISSVAGFNVAKTADTGRIREGVPFTYTLTWRNGSSAQSGGATLVDVMPYPGDPRGSSGFDELSVLSVTSSTATIQYSSLDPAAAMQLSDLHPDGNHPDFAWSSTKPQRVTAVRLLVTNLAAGASGSASIEVLATGVQPGGNVTNDVYGVSDFTATPLRAAFPLRIDTLGATSVSLSQTPSLGEITAAGQQLRYDIRVTNTGQETLSSLSVVTHDFTGTGSAPSVSCPAMVLEPGESMECATTTYVTRQTDLDALSELAHGVTVTGVPPAGQSVSASTSGVIPIRGESQLTLTEIPSPVSLDQAGDTVTLSIIATNTGTLTLNSLGIETQELNGSGALSAIACPATSLAPGSTVTCVATYSVTQADLDSLSGITHRALAHAQTVGGSEVSSNETAVTIPLIRSPRLTLVKSASVSSFAGPNEAVAFLFTVTNTGNVTLTDLIIRELHFSGSGQLGEVSCPQTELAPSASMQCSAQYRTTQEDYDSLRITNLALAEANFGADRVTSEGSSISLPAAGVQLGLTSSVTSDVEYAQAAGDPVTFSIVLTNTGNTALSNVTPSIQSFSGTSSLTSFLCPATVLAALASMTCQASYAVTQTDLDSLTELTLDTSAVASSADGTPVLSDTSPLTVALEPIPYLSLAAVPSMSASTIAGELITFTIEIVAGGGLTLSDIGPTITAFNGSGQLGPLDCPTPLTLSPGQRGVCTVTYAVTQADLDTLTHIELTADATATYRSNQTYDTASPGREASGVAEVQMLPRATLSVVKRASLDRLETGSETVTYTFALTNTGTQTLTNVELIEESFNGTGQLAAIQCDSGMSTLAPGAETRCSARYAASKSDLSLDSITNVASARAEHSKQGVPSTLRARASSAVIDVSQSALPSQTSNASQQWSLALTGLWSLSVVVALGAVMLVFGSLFVAIRRGWGFRR